MFTFAKLKTYQLMVWKHFRLKTRPSKNSRELTEDSICGTKIIKTTCLELHAIITETHALISHPIRALCPSVL